MRKLKLFFACLLMAVLSIGQVWAADVVFTFNTDEGIEALGITKPAKNGGTALGSTVYTISPVSMSATTASGKTDTRVFLNSAGTAMDLRIYAGGTFTFEVSGENKITSIVLAGNTTTGFSYSGSDGTWSGSTWTAGENKTATSVTITATGTEKINTITVNYESTASSGCEKKVTISAGTPSNGTFTLSKDGAQATCDAAVSVVVTPSPAEHYHATGVTAPNSSSISGPNGEGKYTVTYAQNTDAASEINVTFAENEKHTVTWNNNGDQSVTTEVYDGEKPAFPSTPESCDASSTTFIGWATAAWTGKAANLSGKTVYTSAASMPVVTGDVEYFAVFAKGTSAPEEAHNGPSFSRSGTTDTYTSGYTFSAQASGQNGYYQDGSGTDRYVQVLNISTPIFSATPSSITVTATIGGGTAGKDLSNPVYAQLLDKTGALIGTAAVVTEHITTNTGDTYSNISLSTTGITSAYGLRISHVKESGYNVRYYSFSLSYKTGGTTYSDYMTTCTAAGTVATPTFTVDAGTYNVAKSVELNCETADATIYYTTDGTAPDNTKTAYSGAISVDKSMTIKAIAIKDGLTDSEVAEAAYTLKCLAPTITKTPKHFLETATVTITCAEGETIHYTTNGNDPTTSSASYSAPFEISAATTVKAIAVKANWNNSDIASETFTKATVLSVADARDAIDETPAGINNQYVEGTIYQIDGYNSTYHSITYWISDDGTSTNGLEVYSGKGLDGADFAATTDLSIGDVVTVYGTLKLHNSTVYEFDKNNEIAKIVKNVATPTFAPAGSGFLSSTLEVSLATTETGEGVEIRYTTDGSDPTSTSTLYSEPIEITASTTFKAATFKGGNASAVVEKKYVKGTKINVAAALEALDSDDPIADQFVYGIVSTAPTYLNNGKLTYSISDDGTTTSQLKVYNGYNLAGANFTDKTDIQVGDLVTVFGELTEYNSEKEFSQGNHLVEFARLTDPELSWSAASAVVGISGDKNYPSLENPNSLTGITYSSSDPTVASFASENTYEISLHKAGTVTITATFAGDETYKAATVSYELEVRATLVYGDIDFNCDGANSCPDGIAHATNLPNPLPTVTKDGFNFGGWFTNSEKTEPAVAGAALTGDVTLYAKWVEIPTFDDPNYEWQLVSSDAQLIAGKYYVIVHTTSGNTMTKSIDSYATVVASTIEDGVIAYNALGANAAVFQLGGTSAAWTLTEATTGDLLGATTGKNFSWEYNQAWTIEIEDNDASITNTTDGCGVICYNTSANPKRFKPYASSNSGTPLPQLYVWAEKAFKLRYDANGGTNAPTATPAAAGKATVTDEQPTAPTGKIFDGWNENATGTGEDYVAGDEIAITTADVTIYAKWRDPNTYTISYNANGGTLMEGKSVIAPEDVTEGEEYSVKANVYEKEGKIFTGWQYGANIYNANDELLPTEDIEFIAQWSDPNITDYVLVTNINQLKNGDKVYIVAAATGNAMGAQYSTTYRQRVEIEKTADKSHVITTGTEPVELTLGTTDGSYYTFNDGTGYLYANSTNANNIGTQEDLTDAGKWTITIDAEGNTTIVSQGATQYNKLNYNASQPRFAAYKNAQQAVVLYKKLETIREDGVAPGVWGTICPKNEIVNAEGASFFKISYVEYHSGVPYKVFYDEIAEGENLAAGQPYLFQADEDATAIKGFKIGDDATSAINDHGFIGVLENETISVVQADVDAYKYYIVYNNEIRLCGVGQFLVRAERAYLDLSDPTVEKQYKAPVAGRRRVALTNNAAEEAQGFENLDASEKPLKVMIEGQLYILRGERVYDATGRLVK